MTIRRRVFLGGVTLAAGLPGCAAPPRGPAVPRERSNAALPLGIANARFRGSDGIAGLEQEVAEAAQRERRARGAAAGSVWLPPVHLLAISGGGDDGAFGAGLFNGWTEAGNRPVFKLVTGISTGAMGAPFVFLGSAYDAQLRAVYTEVSQADILSKRWLPTALLTDALADNGPLFRTISRHLDEAMLADIARAYDDGRLLLIFSTDLDAQVPVCWNVGAIARSGHPGALNLVRRVLLASAAVPGAFPPVMIDVEAEGERYQEMHVDGGAFVQAFLYPAALGERRREALRQRRPVPEAHAWVVRNARLEPNWSSVRRRFVPISGRAISTMIAASGFNDVIRTYYETRQDGIDYNLAFIGGDFQAGPHEDFDPGYMRALFAYGYERARRGFEWAKVPPVLRLRDPAPSARAQ
jgi:hypothetical protein